MNLLDLFGGAGGTAEVRAVATALAGMERDLHDAVQDHYAALGVDPPADRQPLEERVEELCLLVEYHFDDDLWGFYVAEQAPDGLEDPAAAREHAGKREDEWAATVERWAQAAASGDAGDADGGEVDADGGGADVDGTDADVDGGEVDAGADVDADANVVDDVDDASARERADRLARRRFGVDLETFERSVVGWSRERTLKNALRTPIDADVRRIRLATEVIEGLEE